MGPIFLVRAKDAGVWSAQDWRLVTKDAGVLVREAGGAREIAATSWRFNGWAKYPNWKRDDAAKDRILTKLGVRAWRPEVAGRRIVLEGGALDVDGGHAARHRKCQPETCRRNPTSAAVARNARCATTSAFHRCSGSATASRAAHARPRGRPRPLRAARLVVLAPRRSNDANYRRSPRPRLSGPRREGPAARGTAADAGAAYFAGTRLGQLPELHLANEAVLVPTFNDPSDRTALGLLGDLFPSRTVVGIHAVDLVWGFGTIHCLTQQEPLV
jgi:agmatine deiminase